MAMAQSDYFNSYDDLSVQELMLKDRPRTLAYRKFFEEHHDMVKDKVVMDVGAGTGILSLFAAAAGAKKVFAVEASDMSALCQEIVEENQFQSAIEVIHGAVENIALPEGYQHVDIIISEWMGFYLLHESMLDSVIVARDRFLAPDGILAPSHASLYFAPVDMSEHFQDRAEEWSNIYGFDFSPVASRLNMDEVSKPLIKSLDPTVLKSEPQTVLRLDLKRVTVQDVSQFSTLVKFPMTQDSKVFGFAAWFDVEFRVDQTPVLETVINAKGDACSKAGQENKTVSSESAGDVNLDVDTTTTKGIACGSEAKDVKTVDNSVAAAKSVAVVGDSSDVVALRTGPSDPPTHWKQTVIFLPRTILVESGITLGCRVKMVQDTTNSRHYNITVALVDENAPDEEGEEAIDDDENDELNDSGEESDNSTDHPVPCDCGSDRCRLIAALVEKYDEEHQELGEEAEMVEVEAEMEAARQLDAEVEKGGWPVDSNTSGVSVDGSTEGRPGNS